MNKEPLPFTIEWQGFLMYRELPYTLSIIS